MTTESSVPHLLMASSTWTAAAFILILVSTFLKELPALQQPAINRSCCAAALLGVLLLLNDYPAIGVMSACLLAQLLMVKSDKETSQ